jgi:hypothetical protein
MSYPGEKEKIPTFGRKLFPFSGTQRFLILFGLTQLVKNIGVTPVDKYVVGFMNLYYI